MKQSTQVQIITDQTEHALWEVKNVIDCVDDSMWNREYCEMPCWKHIYHMLHSLDLGYINPFDKNFCEPKIHEKDLNNLDVHSEKTLSRDEINDYFEDIKSKIREYLSALTDSDLLGYPDGCEYTRFTLIMGQFRHLHSHMGMLMGFIIDDTGKWPTVLGLTNLIPQGDYEKFC